MDKQALFAGRSGDNKTANASSSLARRSHVVDAPPPKQPPPPPPPTGESKSRSPPMYSRGAGGRGVAATVEGRKAQLKEAEDNRKAANKCLQKTLTRWNPNYFSAAPLFEKAAASYRAAGEENQAVAMYMTAGECQSHESVMAPASAAKDFKEAALITERQGRGDEAAALYLRCAEAWVHADEAGRAAEYIGRSAKLLEATDEDSAAERYVYVAKVMVPEGSDATTNFMRVVGSSEILVQGIRYLASVGRVDQCMEVVGRYCVILQAEGMEHSMCRMYLTSCVLTLAQGDYVKADAAFRNVHLQNTAYLHSEECRVEEDLLTAFKDFRSDLLVQTQNDRCLRRLEPPVVKLAKSLRIDDGGDDEGGMFASNNKPNGTLAEVKARVDGFQDKHSKAASAPSVFVPKSSSPPPGAGPPSLALRPPVLPPAAGVETSRRVNTPPVVPKKLLAESERARIDGGGGGDDEEDDVNSAEKNALFGVAPVNKVNPVVETLSAGVTSKLGPKDEDCVDDATAAKDMGLDLGDLESLLAGSGIPSIAGGEGQAQVEDDGDDLEAMIEAARKEAEALGGLGGGEIGAGAVDDEGDGVDEEEEEDDDDIDLT